MQKQQQQQQQQRQFVAHVAVEKVALHADKAYSYAVPEPLRNTVTAGARVMVPFGGANRRRQGLVLWVGEEEALTPLKPVYSALDDRPMLDAAALELVRFITDHTFCTGYEAARLVLPAGYQYRVDFVYELAEPYRGEQTEFADEEERRIVACLSRRRKPVKETDLCAEAEITRRSTALRSLQERGVVRKSEQQKRKTKDERILMARLTPEAASAQLTPKQRAVAELLEGCGCASVKEVRYYTEASKATLDNMHKRGALEYYERETLRTPYEVEQTQRVQDLSLSADQTKAYEGLKSLLDAKKPEAALLFGITGSGKTHVFLRLIADTVAAGRQAIMLVPEISLTPQMLTRFHAVFGRQVAVIHSGLSLGERMDEYKRIRSGQASIVVGTRSAVFAPVERLGLIIMDEEQEHTYKSESAPRYHARDIARFRCAQSGALLLLASATPDVESYYHALTGRYHLFTLTERFGTANLPEVVVVNLTDEAQDGNAGSVSAPLAREIAENLRRGEQTILLLNRRGFHTLVQCVSCNEVIKCKNCSLALTYHKANDKLMCHYCGYVHTPDAKCPECGGERMKYLGLGTQKAEDEIAALFPDARILRMDADTTMARYSYDEYLERFARGEYDILIGTQMVAKGLDFENVSLVGVLSADRLLYTADFRASERAFSLLTQVVGRSGRGQKKGRAYIQTYTPEHEIIELAARQDYREFYEGEILCRKNLLYPPFCRLCVAGFSGENEASALRAAQEFLDLLRERVARDFSDVPLKVLGPVASELYRVAGRYRYRLIIKCKGDARTRRLLRETLCAYLSLPVARTVSAFVDMSFGGII